MSGGIRPPRRSGADLALGAKGHTGARSADSRHQRAQLGKTRRDAWQAPGGVASMPGGERAATVLGAPYS
eukprot:7086581-Alexandrium_andersonii.AAC.1